MNEYTLKNSYHFYKDLNDLKPRAGNFMVSFDVCIVTLHQCTCYWESETIAIILDRIFKDTDSFYGFDRINFSEFLNITASNCYFLFNRILYKQIDGLSMGNRIAPSLANIFLCHFETILFKNCPNSFKPIFYRRYLDDTFVILEEESQVTGFLNYINSLHDNIQFTVERK